MSSKELLFKGFGDSYETIGKLRFRRYRDLLSAEAAGIEKMDREQTQFQLQVFTLAKRISEAQGKSFDEVISQMQGLGSAGSVQQTSYFADYIDELTMIVAMMPSQAKLEDELVTIAIQSRAEIKAEGGWERIEDWVLDDTKVLPSKFKAQVSEFIRREQAGEDAPEGGRRRGKALPAKEESA